MALTVEITLTIAGTDTGPFDLYSDADAYAAPFEGGITKLALESGYISTVVPNTATIIRVKSVSTSCHNYVDLPIQFTTTTTSTTSTTSTTTTAAPPPTTTTSTTTAAPICILFQITNNGASFQSGTYTACNGSTQIWTCDGNESSAMYCMLASGVITPDDPVYFAEFCTTSFGGPCP